MNMIKPPLESGGGLMWKIHWMWIWIRDLRNCRQFELDIEGSECGGGGALSGYGTIRLSHHCNHNSIWQRLSNGKLTNWISFFLSKITLEGTSYLSPKYPRTVEGKTQFLACSYLYKCPSFLPPLYFFHIFLLFLSKLLMFSSRTILVPLGNKEADKWIAAKVCFQFLCWFFSRQNNYPRMVRRCQGPIWRLENNRQIHWDSLSISNSLLNRHKMVLSFKRKKRKEYQTHTLWILKWGEWRGDEGRA